MAHKPVNPREMGYYLSLAQIGMEMILPGGLGLWLDHAFGWSPWGLIIGGILGFVGGIAHLVSLVNKHDKPPPPSETKT